MKCKKILTALLAAACTMSGCHGDLDIMQDNKLSASNMWIDESDAETATYGIYLYMRDALKSVHDIYLCWGEFRNGLWGAGTNKTLSGVDQTQVRTSTMSSSNAYADWSVMYKTVNQANLILKHVPEMGISESVRNFSLGNAYFSRAWCYFWIARIWGDAPLAPYGVRIHGRRPLPAPRAEGRDLRPDRKRPDRSRAVCDRHPDKAVATPAAVQMLKADYALWMYRVAGGGSSYLTMAEKAIEALNLSASRLESDYAQVFSSANKLNKEVIFAVHQANGEAVNGPGYYLGWNSNYVEAAYQNNPVPITGGNQWWWYTDRYKALLTSVEGDTRTKLTYNRADYGTTIKSIEWTEKGVGQMISGARIFRLRLHPLPLCRGLPDGCRDQILPEGTTAGALTALGEITKRAYGNAAHYTDPSDAAVKRAIVEESLKELVGEGRTWWTLIRLDAVWDYNKDVADKREKATPTFSCGPSRRSPSSRIPSSNRRRAGIDT